MRTERLVLREFVEDDWRAVLAYQSDPRYLRFYPDMSTSEANARAFVGMFRHWQTERPRRRFQLAITLPETAELIGNCGVRIVAQERGLAEIGYELAPVHWGHGYATEAARVMLAVGFAHLNLRRIEAECIGENERSVHVLERIGLRRVAALTSEVRFKNRIWQQWRFAIDRETWQSLPAPNVAWEDEPDATG